MTEVLKMISVFKATIYNWMAAGKFPRQIKLSPYRVVWSYREVVAWMEEKKTESLASGETN